jgi:23S rRNA (pseudouridine1915-N3)-methyltransferase
LKLTIAWIGKTKEPAVQALTNEYLKRLSHYTEAEGLTLKDEGALIQLAKGKRGSRGRYTLVLLDSRGKQFSSEELAQFLATCQDRGCLSLLFAVGPADGFTAEACRHADCTLSLGRMTLAHELARIVLLEQLYRAFTILKKHPYHLGH